MSEARGSRDASSATDAPPRAVAPQPGWAALGLLALGVSAAVFLLATAGGGFGRGTVGGFDLYAMYLPKFASIPDAYARGMLPLWNPFEYAGLPLHGTAQGSALYLPVVAANAVFADPLDALQVLYFAHIALFVGGALGYLRRCGLSTGAATFGAAFGIAAFFRTASGVAAVQPHYLFETAFLPAILWAWDALLDGRPRAGIALALLLGLQWLPGYPEFPMDTAVLLGIVALARAGPRRTPIGTRVGLVCAVVAAGLALAAAQLLPLAETTQQSARLGSTGHYASIRASGFGLDATTLGPRTLGSFGAPGLLLVLLGALGLPRLQGLRDLRGLRQVEPTGPTDSFGPRAPGPPHRPAWLCAFLFAFFAVAWPLSILYAFPPYSLLRFAWGWTLLTPVFGAFLAALAVDRLRAARPTGPASLDAWLPSGLALAVALAAWLGTDAASSSGQLGALAALACAVLAWPPLRARGGGALVAALALAACTASLPDLAGSRALPAPDLESRRPRVEALRALQARLPNQPRFVSLSDLGAGAFLAERLPAAIGHEAAVPPARIVRLNRFLGIGLLKRARQSGQERPFLQIWQRLAAQPRVASLLGIGLVVAPESQAAPLRAGGYRRVATLPEGDTVLFREPLPRAFVVHEIVRAAGPDESFARVTAPDFDPRRLGVVEGDAPVAPLAAAASGAREIVEIVGSPLGAGSEAGAARRGDRERPEIVRLRASLASPGLVVLRDTHYPGWRVEVDGESAEPLLVDHAFRGVAVPAGEHEIVWRYAPRSVTAGLAISAAALLGLALLCRRLPAGARSASRGERS